MERARFDLLTAWPGGSVATGSTGKGVHRSRPRDGGSTQSCSAPKPTDRARAWTARGRWSEAEAAFNEAVLARPFHSDVLLERARFRAARSQPDKASNDFIQAYALVSRDPKLIEMIARTEGPLSSCHRTNRRTWPPRSGVNGAMIARRANDGPRPPRTMGRPSGFDPRTSRFGAGRSSRSGPLETGSNSGECAPTSSPSSVQRPIRFMRMPPPGLPRWLQIWTLTANCWFAWPSLP